MHCTGCANTVHMLLSAHDGVQAAEVSYERGEARVLYEPALTDTARIAAAIEKPGYRVLGEMP